MTRRMMTLAGAAALVCSGIYPLGCIQLTVDQERPEPDGGDGDPTTDSGGTTAQPNIRTAGPGLSRQLPDGTRYDGSIESMECESLPYPDQGSATVREVALKVGIQHSWVGDLVIKVVSPQGTVTTVLSRAGLDEPSDDGSFDPGGDSSDLAASDRITFRDGAPFAAERMGDALASLDVICRDDHRCDYAPSPGSGPGTSLADFEGEPLAGSWQVCVADASDGDTGVLQLVELSVVAW